MIWEEKSDDGDGDGDQIDVDGSPGMMNNVGVQAGEKYWDKPAC